MPRRVSLVVLHEDRLHQSFAAAFLNASNLPTRGSPRMVNAGSRAGVVARFPMEVRAMLRAGGETHLIVLIDADGTTLEQTRNLLLREISEGERSAVGANQRWIIISPNWELENWIHNIEGRPVDETRNHGLTMERDSDCRPAARTLAHLCLAKENVPNALPSLARACQEWQRYIKANDL